MSDRPTPETDAMEYRFINHDSCAGESLKRVADDKDVTWDDAFRGDSCPSDFARRLERQRDELLEIANRAVSQLEGNLRCEETCKCSGRHQIAELQAAIDAAKGGAP